MKAFIRKIRSIKKRKLFKDLVGTSVIGLSFKYGRIHYSNESSSFFVDYGRSNQQFERQQNPYQQYTTVNNDHQSSIEDQAAQYQSQISEPLKSALEVRSGDLGKVSSPGARAKSRAKANANQSGSSILPGASAFGTPGTPQHTYCTYHKNTPLSCKPRIKTDPFPGDGGNGNNPPPENGQTDLSQYKGGPSPFKNYNYKNPSSVAKKIGFNQPKRLNKSYDKHAEKCFGMQENRNNQSLGTFKNNVRDLATSADSVIKGSYRYADPAYIYLKEINGKMTALIVNATDYEYITIINPTINQLTDLEINNNLGLDTRPTMELRLRGPKNGNL